MYKIIITNSFSISMLPDPIGEMGILVIFKPVSIELMRYWCAQNVEIVSAIGHADTAKLISGLLGRELPANRITIKLTGEENLIVAQYTGTRLPEGATTLPEGAKIEFWKAGLLPLQ